VNIGTPPSAGVVDRTPANSLATSSAGVSSSKVESTPSRQMAGAVPSSVYSGKVKKPTAKQLERDDAEKAKKEAEKEAEKAKRDAEKAVKDAQRWRRID
jgi:hypothetical protein